jgi:hypothetical protein
MNNFPFQKDDGKRKWMCFVCGVQYESFTEFKDHILDKHDEGRDYVLCPLTRCGAPVRDLRMHYKCKHPSEKAPKGVQLKATIWRDRTKSGKLKNRKPKFRQGSIISDKNGGKEMKYRSGYECEVYECLEALKSVKRYDAEPFSIQYTFQGQVQRYIPDITIEFTDGRVEVWEIKPSNQTHLERNQKKWEACNEHCKTRGWEFKVITEKGIGLLREAVAEQRRQY